MSRSVRCLGGPEGVCPMVGVGSCPVLKGLRRWGCWLDSLETDWLLECRGCHWGVDPRGA